MAAAPAVLLGYPLVLAGLLTGIEAAGLAALFLLATRHAGCQDTVAYSPDLALGA